MIFTFKPISEAEAMGLLTPGTYDFTVKSAENAISKKGNPMIKMNVTVFSHEGREHFMYDYLMEAMAYKLRHFCEAADLMDKYEQGHFDASDCVGKSGKCKVKVEEAGEYPAKNSIQDYIKPSMGDPISVYQKDKMVKIENQSDDEIFGDPAPF